MIPLTSILAAALSALAACEPPTSPNTNPAADARSVAQANNAFAIDLYHRLDAERAGGNVVFSPLSISTALGMTHAGARGETAREMERVLHLPRDAAELHRAVGELARAVGASGEAAIANRAWLQERETILDAYRKLLAQHFDSGVERIDFSNPAAAAARINAWVERATNDRITDLVAPELLSRASLVLTNAIAFKGKWASPFDPQRTADSEFTLETGERRLVPMMNQHATFGYFRDEAAQGLEMKFDGGDLALVILMPNQGPLSAFERSLTADRLSLWLAQLQERPVQVRVPRVTLTGGFGLGEALQSMGMRAAFGPGADFSGINGQRDLFISAVEHKAFFEMNEEGAEAAAATGVILSRAMPPSFRVNRPFIFLIRDRATGAILFMGRVMDPPR